ncbi:hypothetical protein N7510_005970 [Penicillium lagena]|uniref:uncharacterized protein n=1 Tax=Penicillium lagena TaxID=94218 RepID=UPI00253FED6F|nr:uncharacterized protein N7510_005970 [Penicillium lagena]KAJ5612776.1 hypothetical protein N7510_005970 [Penicillium lagena]
MEQGTREPCYTCRRRRIQCDRSQMPCAKCVKAGIECFDTRPLRWVKGIAIRGKMQGHSYDGHSAASPVATIIHTSTKSEQSLVKSSTRNLQPTVINFPFMVQHPSFSTMNRISKYYLDYCGSSLTEFFQKRERADERHPDNERICKLFIVYDSERNPFRNLIPLGFEDPVLLKAILTLAARHHANSGQPFHQLEGTASPEFIKINHDALLFKHEAVKALSSALADTSSAKRDSIVASIFLLIFLDLLESGSSGWNFHLEGAKRLIAYTEPPESQNGINGGLGQTVQEIRTFMMKQIHLIEILGATFLRPKLLSQPTPYNQSDAEPPEAIEQSFLGCPGYLLSAIQRLSARRDSIAGPEPLDDIAIQSHVRETTAVIHQIQAFDCYIWACSLKQPQPQSSSRQEIGNLCKLSQTYKTGALIYGGRILDALSQDTTPPSGQDGLVSESLGLIDALREDQDLFKCILWPIFVTGLECRWQAEREFLTGCLDKFWIATKCLNVINAAEILQEYWQQEDSKPPGENSSRWIFNIGRAGQDWLLI